MGAGDGVRELPEPPLDPPLKSVNTEVNIIYFQTLRSIALRMYYSSQNIPVIEIANLRKQHLAKRFSYVMNTTKYDDKGKTSK